MANYYCLESRTNAETGKVEFLGTAFTSEFAARAKAYSRLEEYRTSKTYSRGAASVIDEFGGVVMSSNTASEAITEAATE